jgi:hypothetical protein
MSRLRKKLESARREYRSAHYPGDLSADVLRPARHWGRWVGLAGALAAAALVMLAIVLHNRPQPPQLAEDVTRDPDIAMEETYVSIPPAFSPSEMGSEQALTVPASDFSFSMPTITFVEDESTQETSTTQEAVS